MPREVDEDEEEMEKQHKRKRKRMVLEDCDMVMGECPSPLAKGAAQERQVNGRCVDCRRTLPACLF